MMLLGRKQGHAISSHERAKLRPCCFSTGSVFYGPLLSSLQSGPRQTQRQLRKLCVLASCPTFFCQALRKPAQDALEQLRVLVGSRCWLRRLQCLLALIELTSQPFLARPAIAPNAIHYNTMAIEVGGMKMPAVFRRASQWRQAISGLAPHARGSLDSMD